MIRLLVVVLSLAAAGGAAWYFEVFEPSQTADATTAPPVSVEVSAATTASVKEDIVLVGTIAGRRQVSISPFASGHVTEVLFDNGEKVVAGTPLFQLDDRTASAGLRSAKAQLAESQSKLDRDEQLLTKGLITPVEVEAVRAEVAALQSDLESSQYALDILTIKAPFDGTLGVRETEVGAFVNPGEALVELTDLSSIRVEFRLPERFIGKVEVGQAVEIQLDAVPGETFAAAVTLISPVVDDSTRTVLVRAEVAKPDPRLRPGLFGRVALITGTRPDAIVVPESALVVELTGDVVYVVEDGTAKRRAVKHGPARDGVIEVTEGLEVGDQVITKGQFAVQDGTSVSVVTAATS